ncbi:EAL domain-containing protein [Gammaproteobacteria bacterium AS21]|jgi:diguanylate cyclase (GGDEF)-like protein
MSVICNNLTTAVWVYDIDNYCIHWANQAALDLWESTTLTELVSRDFKPITSDAVQKTLLDYRETFKLGKKISNFWQFSPNDILKETFCQMSGYAFSDNRIGILCEATLAELVTHNSLKHSTLMLSTYDLTGQLISSNPPFKDKLGGVITSLAQLFPLAANIDSFIALITTPNPIYSEDILLATRQGQLWFSAQATVSIEQSGGHQILVQQFDINERKLEEVRLSMKASTDPLTGLLNRRGLNEALAAHMCDGNELFIFYLDLDNFKMINDSMGHATGDHVLKTLSKRLLNNFHDDAAVCRFGGDEFILIVKKTAALHEQTDIADKLIGLINQPYFDGEMNPIQVFASIGCALYPSDGADISKLLIRADAAMYMAKSLGKKREVYYEKGMENNIHRKSLIAKHLYLAIENQELTLYYQPIMDMRSNEIYSFEALIRWENSIMGAIPPEEMMAVAERIGVLIDIENWVINQAIKDLAELRKLTSSTATIAINISGIHFSEPSLADNLMKTLALYKLTSSDLVIELTESSLIEDINAANTNVDKIRNLGISISIDDFGTGYSSLAYLHQIPASVVKIDKLFTQRFMEHTTTITHIHQLLNSLNIETLIEGVETQELAQQLLCAGLYLQQGFFHAMPKPLSAYRLDNVQ